MNLTAWFFKTFPQTFRRHSKAFALSVLITIVGMIFGGMALTLDPKSKPLLLPFSHLHGDPRERVKQEESASGDPMHGARSQFSAQLMTHNTKVAITTLALGLTWGIGTILVLFYNGIVLGAVVVDYVAAGQTPFLIGWLLPHGAFEIPAILMGGQAGLVLANALVGWGKRAALGERLRRIGPDLVTLIFGVAALLVWAGIVESFFSQYHEPILPYAWKIAFGVFELAFLICYLAFSGRTMAIHK